MTRPAHGQHALDQTSSNTLFFARLGANGRRIAPTLGRWHFIPDLCERVDVAALARFDWGGRLGEVQ